MTAEERAQLWFEHEAEKERALELRKLCLQVAIQTARDKSDTAEVILSAEAILQWLNDDTVN